MGNVFCECDTGRKTRRDSIDDDDAKINVADFNDDSDSAMDEETIDAALDEAADHDLTELRQASDDAAHRGLVHGHGHGADNDLRNSLLTS